jgi:heptosyltransferase-1
MSRPPRAPAALPDTSRLLVLRTGAIGDVMNALVFAAAVRDARPAAYVGWVVHPLSAPLLEGNPAIDRVHVWRRGGGVRGLVALLRELRAERYDVAVDLQRLQKSAFLAWASGAPRRLGHDRRRTKEHAHLWHREHLATGDPRSHMVDQYLEFARHLGVAPDAPRWPWPPLARGLAFAARTLPSGRPRVVLNLGASKPEKLWPAASFGALAGILANEGVACVLTGGRGDRATADTVLRAAGAVAAPLDLVGHTDLIELAGVLVKADLVVTADTGPMHMAVALGTPVVAVFGPGDAQRTGPYGAPGVGAGNGPHVVLREPPWDGQHLPSASTAAVTVEAVLGEVRSRLRRTNP